ncbi:MAG: sugar ABC transporter permease [Clostridia bacterium]|nr:sugar ABC transporter permease [Clostridia bacterium]
MDKRQLGRWFPVFVLPTLAAFCVAFFVPFVLGVWLSFNRFTTVSNARFVGLENYIRAFTADSDFVRALGFSALFTAVSVVTINLLAFALALLLTRGLRGTNLLRSVFFMPNLIGGIVLGYVFSLLINGILSFWGVDITYSATYGFWGLVALNTWQLAGYMMVIYIAGLQNIPGELIEAASIDGASAATTLWRVKLPLVMPSITICTFLTLANSFKMFDQNLALTAGAPERETQMLALDIYQTFYGRSGWQGVGQAKAVLFFLLVAALATVQLRLTRSREVDA